jgi:hypothetical protein
MTSGLIHSLRRSILGSGRKLLFTGLIAAAALAVAEDPVTHVTAEIDRASAANAGTGMPELPATFDPAKCDPTEIEQARKQGAALATAQLRKCVKDIDDLQAQVAACQAGAPNPVVQQLEAAIMELHQLATGADAPAVGLNPGDALTQIEASLADMGLRAPAADGADLDTQLAEAERRVTELTDENARLQAEVERLDVPPEPPPAFITPEQFQILIAGMIGNQDCEDIDVTVDAAGALGIRGTASNERLSAIRAIFDPIAAIMPGSLLDVVVAPGGGCNLPLGEGWAILPGDDGAITMITYDEGVADLGEALPGRDECSELNPLAREHEQLKDWFARGRNPLIWCRNGGNVGICKRAAYGENWTFSAVRGPSYSAFPILRAR